MKNTKYKINRSHRYFTMATKKLSERELLMVIAFFVGISTAFAAFVFEWSVTELRLKLSQIVDVENVNILFLITPVIGIILVTLFLKYIIKDNISHGVTKVLYAITHRGSKIKAHNTYSSIIAGVTTIGFGGSVGPEAPMVMTGSAIGSTIGQFFRLNYRNTTILLGCGAAGALAAIFKAPIAGVIFVMEVLMLDISMLSIIPVLISAVTATTITYFLHGFDPAFPVADEVNKVALKDMPYFLALAPICGVVSFSIIFLGARIEMLFKKIKSQYIKWIIGGVVLGILIFLFPPLYGQGYNSITNLLDSDLTALFSNTMFFGFKDNTYVLLAFIAVVIIFKPIAMACTNAAGGVGGAFAPSLFLGAFTGFFVATLINYLFGLSLPVASFTLVGMAGVMSGAMNSPLTAVFLIAEISGGYQLFVPLMLVSAVSFAISYYFSPYSVYTREFVLKGDTVALSKERSLLFIDFNKLVENNFAKITEDMTLGDIVEVVASSSRNIFPVVTHSGEFVGVVTLDDIRADMFDRSLYNRMLVSDYMNRAPDVIIVDEPISNILQKFDNSGAWNLPVVTSENHYMGFVSKSKIFSEYRNELQNK